MKDLIIIGAGPAGLSAAIYGLRAGRSVLILEAKSYGGQIVNTPAVENYPGIKNISGYEFAVNLYEQAIGLGAEIAYGKVEHISMEADKKIVITQKNRYEAKSVIIATGARNRALGLDKEEQLTGAGISYCATCDGMFYRDKKVAVIGGGNTALEDAGFLSIYCDTVYLVHRRDTFRGEAKLAEHLQEKNNVKLVLDSVPIQLLGDQRLQGLVVENVKTHATQTLDVEGVFVAIGQIPDTEVFSNLVQLDEKGYIVAGESCKTSADGIFAAGDCRTKTVRQLATATADGAVAALGACEYIDQPGRYHL